LIIGLTNIIPYVGPFIGSVPAIIITLLVMPSKTIPIILIILALQQFDGLVLGPLILGDKMRVSPFWIIIAVTIGGALNGFVGMLLGVPVLVLIKTVIEEIVSDKLKNKSLEKIDELKIDSHKGSSSMSVKRMMEKLKNKQ
jgi:predicted PurR-regulated permease PerM